MESQAWATQILTREESEVFKLDEVYTDWLCNECTWVRSKIVRFEKPLDWIRWSTLAATPPKHECENGGVPQLNSVQLLAK